MKTLSRTFAIITGLVAGLVWPAAASERHPGDDKNTSEGSSRFGATACRLPSDGHIQMGKGGAFKGARGGGSYGDIFFASGAGTRVNTHNSSSGSSSARPSGPSVGSGSGTGSGSGSGGGTPATGGGNGSGIPGNPGGSHHDEGNGPGDNNGTPGGTFMNPNNPHFPEFPGNGNHNGHRNKVGGIGVAATPEPGSILLLGTSLVGLLSRFGRRRRNR
jgi:hypothetical protein